MLNCQKSQFNLPDDICYLNCSYMSPLHKDVEAAGKRGIERKSTPHLIRPEDFFEDTEKIRSLFAGIINVPYPQRIVIVPSVSYGMANVINNVKISPKQNVILAGEQFPSNVYPWMRLAEESGAELKIISMDNKPDRGKLWNQSILDAINNNTAVVALPHAHWADGTKFDLPAIRAHTRDVGALLIIDGTQSVGAFPMDVEKLEPDALVCAGYKWLLGPYGIGLAYYGPAFDHGVPIEENWINRQDSQNFSELVNYQTHYQPGALRYEVGEHSNFILIPMMLKALEIIDSWGVDNIQNYCFHLVEDFLKNLTEAGYSIEDPEYRGSHLFGIRLAENMDINSLKERFAKEKVSISIRGDSIRVSPNVYNEKSDIQLLTEILVNEMV